MIMLNPKTSDSATPTEDHTALTPPAEKQSVAVERANVGDILDVFNAYEIGYKIGEAIADNTGVDECIGDLACELVDCTVPKEPSEPDVYPPGYDSPFINSPDSMM